MTLAEALEPLYRSYLRRLDEMAARLPAEALLTEKTTRDEEGRLALGEGGLPLRFDVADARDGHTYEVHGARADAPLAGEMQVGRVQVRLEPGNWEELPLVCVFDGEPLREDAEELADLVRGFATLSWYGGFAAARPGRGAPGADRWAGRLHGVRVGLHENELWAVLDLGTLPPSALQTLCEALSGYCEDRVPLAYVRIGGKAPEPGAI
ncbi:MAG: hypothetical protein E6J78_13105 [Deltaproteobacteria bacterium]|nr:MAG: hypothetical protein E6J78_13105 [Deltaproteobacteria bacterium]